jgi:hypothetical protein
VRVEPGEYQRLLGYPPDFVLSGRARELAEWAREWYGEHGRPWIFVRRADSLELTGGTVRIDAVDFCSADLQESLVEARADQVYLAATSAGPEAEEEAQRRWRQEEPDESFFLTTCASAVAEHLVTSAGARLCAWADAHGRAVLPHFSPGSSEWDIAEQGKLLRLIQRDGMKTVAGKLEALESGALRPEKSSLAVFGVTMHADRVRQLAHLVPCGQCSMGNCQFRRAPYLRARRVAGAATQSAPAPREYTVNSKALQRWTGERLLLRTEQDGTIHASFRYDGTTCTNMGRPLAFLYEVTLGPRQQGYPILEQTCGPAPGNTGYTAMCEYLRDGGELMAAIGRDKPLAGMPLERVLTWRRAANPAGCFCDAYSREHKWGLVLETIHYALHRHDD